MSDNLMLATSAGVTAEEKAKLAQLVNAMAVFSK